MNYNIFSHMFCLNQFVESLCYQIKVLESKNRLQKQELVELQSQVCQEEQRAEEAQREAFVLSQRVLESEAAKEAALSEVSGK